MSQTCHNGHTRSEAKIVVRTRHSRSARFVENKMRRFSFVLVFMLATAPAFAHDAKGPNGGRVYLTDTANTAVAMDRYKGLAVGGKSERVDLAPAGGNRLTGTSIMAI